MHTWLRRAEWCAGLLLTALACHLHATVLSHAGGLWRDEVVSFNIAASPTFGKLWSDLTFESAPGLFHVLLRIWLRLGGDVSDLGLRLFGCLIGLGVLGALWVDARLLGYRVPLISLALFALPALSVRTTDAIRPYGVGMLCALLAFGLIWRVVEASSARRVLLATLAAVLSVQALFQNVFLLLAVCLGGMTVAARHRLWTRAAQVGGLGLAATMSLTIYLEVVRRKAAFKELVPFHLDLARIREVFAIALADGADFMLWIWIALAAAAVVVAIHAAWQPARTAAQAAAGDRLTFAMVAAVSALVGWVVWLKILNLPTQPWYYLPLMAVLAVALDAVFGVHPATALRVSRLCLAIVVAALVHANAVAGAKVRQTNVDLIAAELRSVGEQDLILVYPWYCGATFSRYYAGRARWTTLPPLEDQRLQRLDLLESTWCRRPRSHRSSRPSPLRSRPGTGCGWSAACRS